MAVLADHATALVAKEERRGAVGNLAGVRYGAAAVDAKTAAEGGDNPAPEKSPKS